MELFAEIEKPCPYIKDVLWKLYNNKDQINILTYPGNILTMKKYFTFCNCMKCKVKKINMKDAMFISHNPENLQLSNAMLKIYIPQNFDSPEVHDWIPGVTICDNWYEFEQLFGRGGLYR